MTRTAISPRLATRTFPNMSVLWLAHRLGRPPIRRNRFHQPLPPRRGALGLPRGRGGGGRQSDRRTGSAGPYVGGAGGVWAAHVGPAAARPTAHPCAQHDDGGGRRL